MSDLDLRLVEAAEDAHARQLADADELMRLYESEPYWWPRDATEGELTAFAELVLKALTGPHENLRGAIQAARHNAFHTTAMRRARIED